MTTSEPSRRTRHKPPAALSAGIADSETALLVRQRSLHLDWPALRAYLQRLRAEIAPGPFSVALVSDAAIRRLNRDYRHKDYATDVLSFPAPAPRPTGRKRQPGLPPGIQAGGHLGDIVIATPTAARAARQFGWTPFEELQALTLHGLLHLMGYDHETDRGEMARAEKRWGRRLGLPQTLLSRRYVKSRPGS